MKQKEQKADPNLLILKQFYGIKNHNTKNT